MLRDQPKIASRPTNGSRPTGWEALLYITIPLAGNQMKKQFLVRFRYRHFCVRVMMRPSDYFIRPHLAHGAIWVWVFLCIPCTRYLNVFFPMVT